MVSVGIGLSLTSGAGNRLPSATFDFTGGSYDADALTFTRASAASYLNASGVLASATTDTLRDAAYEYDLTDTLTGPYMLIEAAATNEVTAPRDLTNAAWTKSASMAAALNASGVDGTSNSATTLTASAANQTVTEALTLTEAEYTFSARIKRVTGAGRIDITLDGGTTWHEVDQFAINPAGPFMRVFATQTLANPEVGFRIVNSGDAIIVDACQLEAGGYPTADILTGGATRAADALSIEVIDGLFWDFAWPAFAQIAEARYVSKIEFRSINTTAKTADVLISWLDPARGSISTGLVTGAAIAYPDIVGPATFSLATNASKTGNEFVFAGVAQNAICSDFDLFEVGVTYDYVLDVTSISSGAVRFGNDTTTLREASTTGTYTGSFTATATQARITARNDVTTATFTLTVRRA